MKNEKNFKILFISILIFAISTAILFFFSDLFVWSLKLFLMIVVVLVVGTIIRCLDVYSFFYRNSVASGIVQSYEYIPENTTDLGHKKWRHSIPKNLSKEHPADYRIELLSEYRGKQFNLIYSVPAEDYESITTGGYLGMRIWIEPTWKPYGYATKER